MASHRPGPQGIQLCMKSFTPVETNSNRLPKGQLTLPNPRGLWPHPPGANTQNHEGISWQGPMEVTSSPPHPQPPLSLNYSSQARVKPVLKHFGNKPSHATMRHGARCSLKPSPVKVRGQKLGRSFVTTLSRGPRKMERTSLLSTHLGSVSPLQCHSSQQPREPRFCPSAPHWTQGRRTRQPSLTPRAMHLICLLVWLASVVSMVLRIVH